MEYLVVVRLSPTPYKDPNIPQRISLINLPTLRLKFSSGKYI